MVAAAAVVIVDLGLGTSGDTVGPAGVPGHEMDHHNFGTVAASNPALAAKHWNRR